MAESKRQLNGHPPTLNRAGLSRRSWHLIKAVAVLNLLALSLFLPTLSYSQTCTWGGTSPEPPTESTFLRSYKESVHAPGRVAIDSSGRVYVTDPPTGQIFVWNRFGRLSYVMEGLGNPLGIAVDGSTIYVAESARGSVSAFDEDWNPLFQLGQGEGEFLFPNDIAIDRSSGRVYVSDSRANAVKAFENGGLIFSFGEKGKNPGQFDFPTGIYFSPNGELFVGDQNNDRIQVFDPGGNFLRCFGRKYSFSFRNYFGRIQGITGDDQRLYVADAFQGHVKVFDRWGGGLTTIGSFGQGPGQLRIPIGLAIDPYKRLFVSSANSSRVEVFGIDDFIDPLPVPAVVDIESRNLKKPSNRIFITAYIEIEGYALQDVDLATVTANGVPAFSSPWAIGDHDSDGIPDLMVKFDAPSVLETLPVGEADIAVAGELIDGTLFEGSDLVQVTGKKVLSGQGGKGKK